MKAGSVINSCIQFPCVIAEIVINECNTNSKGKNVFIVSESSIDFSGLYSISSTRQNYDQSNVYFTMNILNVVLNRLKAKLIKEIIVFMINLI